MNYLDPKPLPDGTMARAKVEAAVGSSKREPQSARDTSVFAAHSSSNLGGAPVPPKTKHNHKKEIQDLERTINLLRQKVAATPDDTNDEISSSIDLANHLEQRFDIRQNIEDLREATAIALNLAAAIPSSQPYRADFLDVLGNRLERLFVLEGSTIHLDRATRFSRLAVGVTPRHSTHLSRRLVNLARKLQRGLTPESSTHDFPEESSVFVDAYTLADTCDPYRDEALLSEMEQTYLKVLEAGKESPYSDCQSTFSALNNLGSLYHREGRLAEAERMYLAGLASYRKMLATDYYVAITSSNLASLYYGQGKLAEAQERYRKALVIYEKLLGFHHISSLLTAYNTGCVAHSQGDLVVAEAIYQQALAGVQVSNPSDIPMAQILAKKLGQLHLQENLHTTARDDAVPTHTTGYADFIGLDTPVHDHIPTHTTESDEEHTMTTTTNNRDAPIYTIANDDDVTNPPVSGDGFFQSSILRLEYWPQLLDYLVSEFDPPWDLDDMVVLVSDYDNTWCTTCKAYINWIWGSFGCCVLSLVQSFLNNTRDQQSPTTHLQLVRKVVLSGRPILSIHIKTFERDDRHQYYPILALDGTLGVATLAAQVIRWLFDALRTKESNTRHGTIRVPVYDSRGEINAIASPLARGSGLLGSDCWYPLFGEKAVSTGRLPERPTSMKGLEIDYQLMIAVSGVDVAAFNDGGIYLDGYRSALYPIRYDAVTESMQWHLEVTKPPAHEPRDHDSLSDSNIDSESDSEIEDEFETVARSRAPPSVWYKTSLLSELTNAKRNFVGWCTSAIITFGTSLQQPGNLQWSDAKCKKKSVIESTTNLNLSLSFHGIGANVNKSFKRGRTERNPYEDHEANLRAALISARKNQILLLRPSTKQAWLVPKTSVLLQVIQSYMACLMAGDSSLRLPLCFAPAGHDGGELAYQALWDHRDDLLPLGDGQNACHLSNILRMFIFALGKLVKTSEGSPSGWEMNDLVDPPELFDFKESRFRWRQLPWLGGWNQLLPEIRLVLFFEGLDDPIVSDEPHGCLKCTSVPEGKNLLGVTMLSLKHFTRRFGSKYLLGSGQLTEKCFWHSPGLLFQRMSNGKRHRCSAVQRVVKNPRGEPPSMEELEAGEKGAVIFEPCALSEAESRLEIS